MAFPMKSLLDDLLLKSISDMGEGVLVFDFPRVVYANEAFQILSGYSEQQLTGLSSFLECIAEQDRPRVENLLQRFLSGENPLEHVDFLLARRLGKTLHVEAVFSRWPEEGKSRLVALVRERGRRSPQTTRLVGQPCSEVETRLRSVFNSGLQAIHVFDRDGRLVDLNAQARTMDLRLLNRVTHIGEKFEECLLGEGKKHFRDDFARALKGEAFRVERPIRREDGKDDWCEFVYSPILDAENRVTGVCMDTALINERKTEQDESRENEEKYRQLFENANDAIYLNEILPDGSHGKFLEVNRVACQRMGYTRDEFLKMTPLDILEPRQRRDMANVHKKLTEQTHYTYERVQVTRSGLSLPVEISAHMFTWKGRPVVLSISRDLTERKRAEETIRRQAYYDPLTNLPNRILFKDRLEQAMAHAKRSGTQLVVVIMDLDRFKNINETLGHGLGDRLLIGVAERLLKTTGEGVTLARLSGDEFIFLHPQTGPSEEVYQYATSVIAALKEPFRLGPHEVHVTCSVGLSLYPDDGEDPETVLKNAEAAMYRAKEQGRNNYQLYTSVMNAKAFKMLLMENSLRRAFERNEFIVHYQPQVDLEAHRVVGAEALVRWKHPDLGLVFPSEFISLAEETGLIVPLGEWVLRESCSQNKAWQERGLPTIAVSVNLSARQFLQEDLVERISTVLRETGLDPQWLGLEITESLALKDAEFTLATMRDLRAMGVRLSLDDFGTGYSSLSYLKRFPIQTLKIDQSFVRDLTTDPNDAAISQAVLVLAKSLRLGVVAEGVETENQLEMLRAQGCRYAQGYLLSHPLPADEFERFLAQPKVNW